MAAERSRLIVYYYSNFGLHSLPLRAKSRELQYRSAVPVQRDPAKGRIRIHIRALSSTAGAIRDNDYDYRCRYFSLFVTSVFPASKIFGFSKSVSQIE